MKVLLSAHSCNPYLGSEAHIGWQAMSVISLYCEVWVFTHINCRKDIEDYFSKHEQSASLHFVYLGQPCQPPENRFIAKLLSWYHYYNWTRELRRTAAEHHRKIGFDLVHHVTVATWRVVPPLDHLNIPMIFGPVGGGEIFPWKLFRILSVKSKGFELLRKISNGFSARSYGVRRILRHARVILATNRETEAMLKKIIGPSDKMRLLSPAFFDGEKIRRLQASVPEKDVAGKLQIFAGGQVEARKGFFIAFHALAELWRAGIDFEYFIGGGGPELNYLVALRKQLGLDDKIIFSDTLHGDEYARKLAKSHVFLLPSLRESSGLTMMESMLAGCVPVIVDCGGPGDIVTDDCGFKIKVDWWRRMAVAMTEVLMQLNERRELIREKGALASARIKQHYSAEHYAEEIKSIYEEAVKK